MPVATKQSEAWAQYIIRKRYEMAARMGKKFTQSDLAEMLKKSSITVYCWERRGQEPAPAEQAKIRQQLGV